MFDIVFILFIIFVLWSSEVNMSVWGAHVFRQAFDQAAVGHGLDAEQVDHLPHRHVLFGYLTDPRHIALTWVGTNEKRYWSNTGPTVNGLVESEHFGR